ncbi:hypothetical protein KC350_g31 [Hortaea werneckii]|nr:hypothetical protein KC350_g31 [Hortaea werneckii]
METAESTDRTRRLFGNNSAFSLNTRRLVFEDVICKFRLIEKDDRHWCSSYFPTPIDPSLKRRRILRIWSSDGAKDSRIESSVELPCNKTLLSSGLPRAAARSTSSSKNSPEESSSSSEGQRHTRPQLTQLMRRDVYVGGSGVKKNARWSFFECVLVAIITLIVGLVHPALLIGTLIKLE